MPPMVYPRGSGRQGQAESNQLPPSSDHSRITCGKLNCLKRDDLYIQMDFISWSSALLKLSGYEGTQNQQQLQQQASLLSACWPWIFEQPSATRPASLVLDLAVLESGTPNHFWHSASSSSMSVANFMSSTIIDKQNQLSFGIDRILSNQIGVNQSSSFLQVPTPVWSRDHERQTLSMVQRQEVALEKQLRETRQEQLQQQASVEQQQSSNNNSRRKRSWSRAVFSNLQRKGLEKRFQLQKYITKPDRRQLAVSLGLTDAQVKVWFQNRRMKWRHNKESLSVSNTEDGFHSPIEQQYTEAEVEDVDCLEDCPITPTSHIILHKEASNTVRFTTF